MRRFVVQEDSMRPALRPGDRVLAREQMPGPGDIVVFPQPGGALWLIKRVVAGPGSDVTIAEREILITTPTGTTGRIDLPRPEGRRTVTLLDDEVFVLSDALAATRADSRVYGAIPIDGMAIVWLRYRPIRRLHVLRAT